jgi:hypothetical protein
MEKYQSLPYSRTLREAGGVEGQKLLEKIGYQRSGEKME